MSANQKRTLSRRGQKRIARVFKTGHKTDVYGALLYAIAKTGKPSVTYQELAQVLERDLTERILGQQITSSLGHMATIALENRGQSDAAVAFKSGELHVLDPFLLFYPVFGSWSVDKDMDESEQDESEQDESPRAAEAAT